MINIFNALTIEHFQIIGQLFSEYADSLGFSLCFQDFENELQSLPWEYAEPQGCVLLATIDDKPAGCVALRPLDIIGGKRICEMKRLYVRPNFRNLGVGRALSGRLIEIAKTKGYDRMRLDTVPAMTAAIVMYRSMGFAEIGPYRANPIPGALYMEKELSPI
jgi:ribosomal protein S18 acetylase RimI-like enzyme